MANTFSRRVTAHEIVEHECLCCGDGIPVDYTARNSWKREVRCPTCNALFKVDHDAELIAGIWYDRTKLWRV